MHTSLCTEPRSQWRCKDGRPAGLWKRLKELTFDVRQESKWQVAGTEFRMLYTQLRGAECRLVHTEERNYKGSLKSQFVKAPTSSWPGEKIFRP